MILPASTSIVFLDLLAERVDEAVGVELRCVIYAHCAARVALALIGVESRGTSLRFVSDYNTLVEALA